MLRGLPQLTISPTHNSSPNDLTLATSLSLTHTAGRALSSPRSPSLIGWGVAGAPPRVTIHRFVRRYMDFKLFDRVFLLFLADNL